MFNLWKRYFFTWRCLSQLLRIQLLPLEAELPAAVIPNFLFTATITGCLDFESNLGVPANAGWAFAV